MMKDKGLSKSVARFRGRKIFDAVIVMVLIAVLLGVYFFTRLHDKETIASELFALDLPTRYAFVADKEQPQLIGIDVQSQQNQQNHRLFYALSRPARYLAVSQDSAQLAYSDGSAVLYVRQLLNKQEQRIDVGYPIKGVQFIHAPFAVLTYGDKQISLVFGKDNRKTLQDFTRIRYVHYAPLTQQLIVLDEGASAILRISLTSWQTERLNLPHTWQIVSDSAFSATGEHLLFGVKDTVLSQMLAVVVNLEQNRIDTAPMSAPILQPIINNRGSDGYFLDKSGAGIHWQLDSRDEMRRFESLADATHLVLAQLDTHLLVLTEQAMRVHETTEIAGFTQHTLPKPVNAIFVSADSKRVFFTHQDWANVSIFTAKTQQWQSIFLPFNSAGQVKMGVSYTLCH